MTETTDIKALRVRSNNLRTADQTDAFIDMLLDRLEAERQRADKAEQAASNLTSQLMSSRCAASRQENELAAHRGTQEPYGWVKSPAFMGSDDPLFMLGSALPTGVTSEYIEVFTRQPKPIVVLPRTFWYDHDDIPREIPVLEKKKVVAKLKAAGIVVKDGE